jgi:hypothetical protein
MRKDGFMQRDDMRFAVAAREDGLRRVRSLTVQVGAAGVVSAAVIAVALGHPAGATIHNTTGGGGTSKNQTRPNENSPGSGTSQGNSSPGNSQQGTSPQAPAQNLAPAAGSGQAVSGGS